jgi:hypothetical protein
MENPALQSAKAKAAKAYDSAEAIKRLTSTRTELMAAIDVCPSPVAKQMGLLDALANINKAIRALHQQENKLTQPPMVGGGL